MSEEKAPDPTEVEPEDALEPPPEFGEQDDELQADEWEEDVRERGE